VTAGLILLLEAGDFGLNVVVHQETSFDDTRHAGRSNVPFSFLTVPRLRGRKTNCSGQTVLRNLLTHSASCSSTSLRVPFLCMKHEIPAMHQADERVKVDIRTSHACCI